MSDTMTLLADRFAIPASIEAIIWDMDGVLLDTFGGDLDLCRAAATEITGDGAWVIPASVARHFALEPLSFWTKLLEEAGRSADQAEVLAEAYDRHRATAKFATLPGIEDILSACAAAGIRCAVASSNPHDVVEAMLERAGIAGRFSVVIGLSEDMQPKPAPDLYARAAEALGLAVQHCAFVEDSATGLKAGRAADIAYAVAVATGAQSFKTLARSGQADIVYDRFEPALVRLVEASPTAKHLDTPNDFISHMLEHIAWRLGVGADVRWRNSDWRALGASFGRAVRALGLEQASSATLGMIDDGAAEVMIDLTVPAGLELSTHPSIPLDKVLGQRVEQIDAGADLKTLLEGICEGLGARIVARFCSFEDPHHSWEGLYRAVGICLSRLRLPNRTAA